MLQGPYLAVLAPSEWGWEEENSYRQLEKLWFREEELLEPLCPLEQQSDADECSSQKNIHTESDFI